MEILLKSVKRILTNRNILEKKLKVKIKVGRGRANVSGEEVDEFIAVNILEAISMGFDIETALQLLDPEVIFEKIHIKDLTKRRNLAEVRARVIGAGGRTLDLLSELSGCHVVLSDNVVGIIGRAEEMRNAINAVRKIIQGGKQSSVYAYLERQRKIFHSSDLGLKIKED